MKIKKEEDFSSWYDEVLQEGELVDIRYGVKGFIIYRPNIMRIINQVYRLYDVELEKTDHSPCQFPVVIPLSYFRKESAHVQGFEDEVFWVTKAGSHELEEPLILRPTSETAIYPMYSLWIRTYRDLPIKYYQGGSVYRYETRATRPLLRGREFLWIETHTAHASLEDAEDQVKQDMSIANKVVYEKCGIPFLMLDRPEWDRFAGAQRTYGFDTLLPDGKALQIGTTHLLADNFSKVFDIQFEGKDGSKSFVQQTCYGPGISRIAASVICIHGDDYGLVLPFEMAPVQVVVVPIVFKEGEKTVIEKCAGIAKRLEESGIRVKFDDREQSAGSKFYYWELMGAPVRVEVGPKEAQSQTVTLFRRDNRTRQSCSEENLTEVILKVGADILNFLRKKAEDRLKRSITWVNTKKELLDSTKKGGFLKLNFCGRQECADEMKSQTGGFEVKGTSFESDEKPKGSCAWCGETATQVVYAAKSY
ncbi:MAG: proline--tRNA ligase [Promethearchaeati archaeon SRVP18_Atabeyarchaeia-1]